MLNAVSECDACILIEDGVLAATQSTSEAFKDIPVPVHVLEADLLARGLSGRINEKFIIVNDDQFVQLCCEYSKTVSWF